MSPHAPARRFSILVVDDNHDAADTLALFLRLHGHDARAAYGGEQALAIVRDWQPDAAIVDVLMNGVGGIELASRLRRDATRPTVIVALTGVGTNDELVPVRAGELDSVLLKPVDPNELLRVLNAHAAVGNGRNGMSRMHGSTPAPGALSP